MSSLCFHFHLKALPTLPLHEVSWSFLRLSMIWAYMRIDGHGWRSLSAQHMIRLLHVQVSKSRWEKQGWLHRRNSAGLVSHTDTSGSPGLNDFSPNQCDLWSSQHCSFLQARSLSWNVGFLISSSSLYKLLKTAGSHTRPWEDSVLRLARNNDVNAYLWMCAAPSIDSHEKETDMCKTFLV